MKSFIFGMSLQSSILGVWKFAIGSLSSSIWWKVFKLLGDDEKSSSAIPKAAPPLGDPKAVTRCHVDRHMIPQMLTMAISLSALISLYLIFSLNGLKTR